MFMGKKKWKMNQFFLLHIPKNINAMIAIRFCCLKFLSVHELISVCMGVLIMHFMISGGQSTNLKYY